jgi:hypothetical protein
MADITGHTPVPWSIGGLSSNPGEGHVIESDSTDRTIAWTANSYCTSNDEEYISQEDIANAEFMIRACNSHDALVDTLQSVRWFLMGKARRDPAERKIISQVVDALDKAKGGA